MTARPDLAPRPRIALPTDDEGEAQPTWRDELEAMRVCLDALVPLNAETQARVLGAVICILEGESAIKVIREWKGRKARDAG